MMGYRQTEVNPDRDMLSSQIVRCKIVRVVDNAVFWHFRGKYLQ